MVFRQLIMTWAMADWGPPGLPSLEHACARTNFSSHFGTVDILYCTNILVFLFSWHHFLNIFCIRKSKNCISISLFASKFNLKHSRALLLISYNIVFTLSSQLHRSWRNFILHKGRPVSLGRAETTKCLIQHVSPSGVFS